ncbi:cupin domain-containing protein [Mongoliitalea daihaiensis]|uniref:phosphoheptose isomerase n=1 Tax=Mongoliitalea daihaiensis TaxID=2782006 RepID=UPI001F25A7D5|nr:phosphoheptose isomerase [Mongoliitalea daihaiensis]UJP63260.1 phosphoheptose isomerase [Mongoliitalea daihaiensis]
MKLKKISDENAFKGIVFDEIRSELISHGLTIVFEDQSRPWGGFFVIEESQIKLFKSLFFDDLEMSESQFLQKLSPKILVVAPQKRLSWQYHFRRSEVWKLVAGNAAISRSATDVEGPVDALQIGQVISLATGERHRLIGTKGWGVVAEIWQHVDMNHPSDEDDIVRVQDDFQRT